MLMFVGGCLLLGAGGWAFLYAHSRDPTPDADPMAVNLLSHGAYERLHYGGLALVALGVLLILAAAIRGVRREP